MLGHSGKVNAVKFMGSAMSAGNNIIASGSDDTTIRLWDLQGNTSHPIQIFEEATDAISDLYYHVQEGKLMSSSIDGRFRVYDLRKGLIDVINFEKPLTWLQYLSITKAVLLNVLDDYVALLYSKSLTDCKDGGESAPGEGGHWEWLQRYEGSHVNGTNRLYGTATSDESFLILPSEHQAILTGYPLLEKDGSLLATKQFSCASMPLCCASHPKQPTRFMASFLDGTIKQFDLSPEP
jgi:WD40 repeat protein